MTNGDWIRSMTDEELYKNVIAPCYTYDDDCGECLWNNATGRCVISSNVKKDMGMEWLESEHEERPVHADAPQEEHKGPEPGNIRDAALKELFS